MRVVLIGAGELGVMTAKLLLERDFEVVIIEQDRDKIEVLSDELSCGLLHGDGSKPDILKEAGPEQTDVLFCLTNNDQVNIIASLMGRSLGFKRVVTMIEDPSYGGICTELGLTDTIVPDQTISRYLADLTGGRDILELSTMIKGEARFFSFEASKEDAVPIRELDLPKGARVVCFYREGEFMLAEGDSSIQAGDEVIVLTHSRHLSELRDRWRPSGTSAKREREQEEAKKEQQKEAKKNEQHKSEHA